MFDVGRNRDFRVVLRGEADEDGVVVTSRVLCGSCLSADVQTLDLGNACRRPAAVTAVDSPVHTLDHDGEIGGVHHRIDLLLVLGVDGDEFRVLYYMRYIIISPVCNGCRQVCQMQGSATDLSLSDREGNDGRGFPAAFAVALVVVF